MIDASTWMEPSTEHVYKALLLYTTHAKPKVFSCLERISTEMYKISYDKMIGEPSLDNVSIHDSKTFSIITFSLKYTRFSTLFGTQIGK